MKFVLTGTGLAAALALSIAPVADGRTLTTEPVRKTPATPSTATPVLPVSRTLPPPAHPVSRPVARTVAPVWRPALPAVNGSRGISSSALTGVVQKYCGSCHSPTMHKGNLVLATYDIDAATSHVAITEKMIRKLRAEMMPPPGSKRPTGDTLLALVETLENTLDNAGPINPGSRVFQRLNRPEYARVVKDLLNIDFDADDYLPLDTKSANFDNIADVQLMSPTLLDSYLTAASALSLMAVGDVKAPTTQTVYKISGYVSQHPWDHVEGTPYGTRGGISMQHNFPADAEYELRLNVGGGVGTRLEDIVISIDGDIVQTVKYEKGIARNNESAEFPLGFDYLRTTPIKVKAGQHQVAVAFVRRTEGPYEDLVKPHDWSRASGGTATPGTTESPPLTEVAINGPYRATGVSETASRKAIFTCHPTAAAAQRACANQIITRLATKAYRRPLTVKDKASLMSFYDKAVVGNPNGFEEGVRSSLQAMFASPYFVFRMEPKPANVAAGKDFEINDIDLASRLSFFLWGTLPDERLMTLARHDQLGNKVTFNAEVKRMLADKRSEALATRFAGQWLRLQDLDKVHPDAVLFPDYDQQLTNDFKTETQMFFNDIVKNDRSILTMFNANYTFVNDRLASHYGIPNVTGDDFRRVDYPANSGRQGVMGQGSYLVQTSLGNRTSPVLRGKWVMEVLIGMPPPPPPPAIPDLEQTAGAKDGKPLTTRQRMEIHRADPTCKACHQYMDPIGLSVDNFDVTGKFRYLENGAELDTRGQMYDGMQIATSADLTKSLLSRPIPLVRNFTENLMAYALGRRVEDFDQATVRTIAKDAKAKDYRFSSFVMGVVNSSAFRYKRADAVADDASKN